MIPIPIVQHCLIA